MTNIRAAAMLLVLCSAGLHTSGAQNDWSDEVMYQIFPRSFCDSNGDSIGDLRGITQSLDYLQDLGITALWLNPIVASRCYHNYFADSFDSVDGEFGTLEDFRTLARTVHERGMKLLIDMETQYVTDHHAWFRESFNSPSSRGLVWYNDEQQREPEPGPFDLDYLPSYDGSKIRLISLDMLTAQQIEAQKRIYRFWLDPDGDGSFDDGVDGFRIDHIMDDLDMKRRKTGLLRGFWKPLFDAAREVNPKCYFLCEQADWGFGAAMFEQAGADAVFALPLKFAIRSFHADSIRAAMIETSRNTPAGGNQVLIIENHDVDRFASSVNSDNQRLRIGAALNLTLQGVPCLYYGQEIGMRGMKQDWNSDGNDIPRREAFEWYATREGKEMALWYAGTGPWWEQSELRSNDGVSVEEQRPDSSSLWNFYKALISIRKASSALKRGEFIPLHNTGSHTLTFGRRSIAGQSPETVLVIVNLGNADESIVADLGPLLESTASGVFRDLLTGKILKSSPGDGEVAFECALKGGDVRILRLEQ